MEDKFPWGGKAQPTSPAPTVGQQKAVTAKVNPYKVGFRVRLAELLYPCDPDKGIVYFAEIQDKWVYVFRGSGEFVDEIYAGSKGWVQMKPADRGKGRPPSSGVHYPTPEPERDERYPFPGSYWVPPARRQGEYLFFLSPAQLSGESMDELKRHARPQETFPWDEAKPAGPSRWDPKYLSRYPITLSGQPYYYYRHSGMHDPKGAATCHSVEAPPSDKAYVALIPDPFAWTEDIHLLGYQGALELWDRFHRRKGRSEEVFIASTLAAAMDIRDDDLSIRNELKDRQLWWNWWTKNHPEAGRAMEVRMSYSDAGVDFPDTAVNGPRKVYHRVQADPAEWQAAPSKAKDAANLRLTANLLELVALERHLSRYAKELRDWWSGPRHTVVDWQTWLRGGDAVFGSTAHWTKISARVSECGEGFRALSEVYGDKYSTMGRLFNDAILDPPGGFWQGANGKLLRGLPASILKGLENFVGAIAAEGDERLQRTVGGLSRLLPDWKVVTPKKAPSFWGLPGLGPDWILDPKATSRLRDVKGEFKRLRIRAWFKTVGTAPKAINAVLLLSKWRQGQATWAEKWKLGLDAAGFAMGVVESAYGLRHALPSSEATKAALKDIGHEGLKQQEDKVTRVVRRLAGLSAAIGTVTGAFCLGSIADDAAKAWVGRERGQVAALGVAAVATGVAMWADSTAAITGLILGQAVAGPVGWIACLATLTAVLAGWLAAQLKHNRWENLARFSYLGDDYGEGPDLIADLYGGGSAADFGKNLSRQVRSITGLMASFRMEAKRGDARVTIYPGRIVPGKTVFRITWQIRYGYHHEIWAEVKAEVRVLEKVTITKVGRDRWWFQDKTQRTMEEHTFKPIEGKAGSSFAVQPTLKDGNEEFTPREVRLLVQADVYGDGNLVLPFDSTVSVKDGDFTGTHYNHLVGTTTGAGDGFICVGN